MSSEKLRALIQTQLAPYAGYLTVLIMALFTVFVGWSGYLAFMRLQGFAHAGDLLVPTSQFVAPSPPSQTLSQQLQAMRIFTREDISVIPEATGVLLKGIFFSDPASQSRVLVAKNDQASESYGIGERLQNGLVVYEIFLDKVLFLQDGDLVKAFFKLPGVDFPTMLPSTLFNGAKNI